MLGTDWKPWHREFSEDVARSIELAFTLLKQRAKRGSKTKIIYLQGYYISVMNACKAFVESNFKVFFKKKAIDMGFTEQSKQNYVGAW